MNGDFFVQLLRMLIGVVVAMIVNFNVDKNAVDYYNWYLKGVESCEKHDGLEYLDGGEFTCHNGVVISPDDSKEN